MADLLSIGLSGLSASKTALSVTGNNITNADTAGYVRQTTVQTASVAQQSGNAYLGTGTTIEDVKRIYSQFLNTQLQSATSKDSAAQTYYTQIQQLDSLLADSTTGVSKVLQDFFSAVQTAAASPTDNASRQLVLTQASSLSDRFNAIYDQVADQNSYINEQLSSMASQVNTLATSVANYNLAITQASANGASPNSLLDARDEAVKQLSKLTGATVVEQNGNYNLYIGSGQPLVVGNSVSKMEASPSEDDPTRYAITLTTGSSTQDITAAVSGGEIGGLLSYRSDTLDSTMNELGRMALVIADTVNSQLGQGLDLNGEFGASLFGDINSETLIKQRSVAQSGNSSTTANFQVSIEDSSALTTSDYEVIFTDATHYSVTRLSDGKVFPGNNDSYDSTASTAPVVDGFSLSLTNGSAAAGDKFTIMPTRYGANTVSVSMTDPEQLAFAAPLKATATTGNYGNGSASQPTLITTIDVNDATSSAALQDSLQQGMPLKMVFDTAQTYSVYDSAGNAIPLGYDSNGAAITSGTIVPGNSNTVQVTVPTDPEFTFETTISGSPGAGDSFTFSFNSDGTSDNRNAQSLLDLQNKATVGSASGAGMSVTTTYSSLIEQIGAKTNQASINADATAAVLTQAQSSWDSKSGVNLDEEAANLIKFEQYYNASAQVIQIARSIFDTLIDSL